MSEAHSRTDRRVSARIGGIAESATLAVDAKAKALKAKAVADEARPDLALDRDVAVRGDHVHDRALEHIRAGGDEVGVDLVGAVVIEPCAVGGEVAEAALPRR